MSYEEIIDHVTEIMNRCNLGPMSLETIFGLLYTDAHLSPNKDEVHSYLLRAVEEGVLIQPCTEGIETYALRPSLNFTREEFSTRNGQQVQDLLDHVFGPLK